MNPWIPFVQFALLVAGPASPPTAKVGADAPAADGSRPIAIDIDTSKLGEFGGVFDRRLNHELRAIAKQRGIAVVPQTRGRIRVEVTDTSGKGTAFEYSVETTPWAADAGRTSEKGTCAPCSDEMTVAKITGLFGARFDALADTTGEAPPSESAAEPVGPKAPPPPSQQPSDDDPKKVGALGWAGIGVALAGAATGGAGIVLLLRDDRVRVDPAAPLHVERTSTRRSGIALAVVGGALVISGIVMVAVDQVKRKRRRVAWAPAMAPGFAGFELAGRF